MDTPEIRAALEAIQRLPHGAVHRFDEGPPLAGGLAVLPSAFNPPTRAHIALLEAANALDGISATAAMLTTRNVDKAVFGAGLEYRVGMLLAASDDSCGHAVLASNQARISDQAAALREAFPAAEVSMIVGYDTLVRVFESRYYDGDMAAVLGPFFHRHRLIAANRGEATLPVVRQFLERPEVAPFSDRILLVELPPETAEFSSTSARDAVPDGTPEGIPDAVLAYIRDHGLYG